MVSECTEAALRAAMSGGGTVTFACDGLITLSNTVAITTNTLLDAAGHQITLSGGNIVSVFCVTNNAAFSIANLVISNGQASSGAGILNAGGALRVTNCVFSQNKASWEGAAIENRGEAYLSACVFNANQAAGPPGAWYGGSASGGALENSGTLTADLCSFIANSANGGAGISGATYSAYGGNGGSGAGGAIANSGTLTIMRSTFRNNSAVGGTGGAGHDGDYAGPHDPGGPGGAGGSGDAGNGGAIYNGGTLRVFDTTFASNFGTGGQGGAGGAGNASEDGHGTSGGPGGSGGSAVGGIFNSGDVQLINCTFSSNSGGAGAGGTGGDGGYALGSGGAGGNGGSSGYGAIYDQGSCRLTNCTFAGDSAGAAAGGAGGRGGNGGGSPGSPGTSGGGIRTTGGGAVNTLLAEMGGNCSGHLIDWGHNLSSDSSCGFTNVGSMNNTDPKLGALADNGGPTLTMALLPGSPAIDAGDTTAAPPTDQRGFPRPAGSAADIGAFEYGSVPAPQVSTLPATGVSANSATLNGTVNPNGWPTTAWFQWGATTNYGNLTSVTDLGSGTTALPLSAPLAGLTPGVTYHFRIAATNDYGLVYGNDQSFTTLTVSNSQELVVNGSFEEPVLTSGWQYLTSIPGWTTTFGPGIEVQHRCAGTPFAGDQLVELDSSANSGMAQQIPTVPGLTYQLTFAYSPRPGVAGSSTTVEVLFNDALLASIAEDGLALQDTRWSVFTYSVIANTNESRLEFRAAGTSDSFGGYLDDVHLTPLTQPAAPVPTVASMPATAGTAISATLNGTVNPNGWPTTAWFQWGTTTNYGNLTAGDRHGQRNQRLAALGSTGRVNPRCHLSLPRCGDQRQRSGLRQRPELHHVGTAATVWTLSATAVTTTSATLNGTVNPNGYPTTAWFQWGTTTNYGNLTPRPTWAAGPAPCLSRPHWPG